MEGNPQFKQLALSLVVHPENDDESGETASLPLSVQKEAMTTLLGIAHEVRLEIQNEAIRVDPNTRLSEFGEKIENIESIMKYDDCAQKNKEYALARIESRLALQAHLVSFLFELICLVAFPIWVHPIPHRLLTTSLHIFLLALQPGGTGCRRFHTRRPPETYSHSFR